MHVFLSFSFPFLFSVWLRLSFSFFLFVLPFLSYFCFCFFSVFIFSFTLDRYMSVSHTFLFFLNAENEKASFNGRFETQILLPPNSSPRHLSYFYPYLYLID